MTTLPKFTGGALTLPGCARKTYRCSTMAQTGVSGPVVVDGESFLDALFASAGQG